MTRGNKGKPLEGPYVVAAMDPKLVASWTPQQRSLFAKVEKLLLSNRLARLANAGTERQFLLSRLQIDKTANKLRQVRKCR